MLKADTLHERGKALEDEYFHRIDEALNVRLRESIHRDEAVARASADLFGAEEISKPERAMLDRIQATLNDV